MLPFVFASFCITWLTIFVMVHIQYPFWNIQPIYHQYDYWLFLYTNPFIVHKQRHWKTKYLETNHIFMFPFEDLNTTQKHYFLRLLQGYTLPNDQNVCCTHSTNKIFHYYLASIYNLVTYLFITIKCLILLTKQLVSIIFIIPLTHMQLCILYQSL